MHSKRLKLLLTFGVPALIVGGKWFAQQLREKHNAARREPGYQRVLVECKNTLKLGITRGEVEQHFHTHGTQFKQMCCVANYRGAHVSFVGAGYDDLVKIGEESAPWFCSEHDVYIAFEFNPKSPGEQSETNRSDILKRVSIFHELEGCAQ